MCVCVRERRGSPPQSVNLVKGFVRAKEILVLVGTAGEAPFSISSALPNLDSIWEGILKSL